MIIQVSRVGSKFVVLEDGVTVPNLSFDTHGEAIKAALDYKEANS